MNADKFKVSPITSRRRFHLRCTQAPSAVLEVWPESHWPGFALRQADVCQSYTAW